MTQNEILEIQKIRRGYSERVATPLERLRALDRDVKRPVNTFAYTFGTIGTLILGAGMCLAMPDVISGYMPLGIVVGVLGITMVSITYPIHKRMLERRRKRYSGEIMTLSDLALGGEKH